jgi:hypothetical protein
MHLQHRVFSPVQVDQTTVFLQDRDFSGVKYDPTGSASEPWKFTHPPWICTCNVRLRFVQGWGWHIYVEPNRFLLTEEWKGFVQQVRWLGSRADELNQI